MYLLTTRDINSPCRFCRQGTAHSFKVHAKVLDATDIPDEIPEPIAQPKPAAAPRRPVPPAMTVPVPAYAF